MKALNWIAWASGCAGVLVILLGAVSGLIGSNILPIKHVINYFHVANSFFLMTIALFIFLYRCQCKKD